MLLLLMPEGPEMGRLELSTEVLCTMNVQLRSAHISAPTITSYEMGSRTIVLERGPNWRLSVPFQIFHFAGSRHSLVRYGGGRVEL
jgi:hypothetical protein